MQDAQNLAWKLAYAIQGKASPSLLRSYSEERQPIAAFYMQQAYSRYQKRVQFKKPNAPELEDIVVEIGYRYPTGAFVPSEATRSDLWEDPYAPGVDAGSRFPHVQLVDEDGSRNSTLDLIEKNFVLVAAEADSPWAEPAKSVDLPIDVHVLSENFSPLKDAEGSVKATCKLRDGEALLIRPDGFIAWRAPKTSDGHQALLIDTLDRILRT